ncbi:MAG: enoyl-CoA hydratase, partial [Acidobacteria bacterium]|nr:enoyl-CoA hydratase [Acidobacteriota bacterium]
MPINHDVVGATGAPVTHSWTSRDSLLYALGVGAGLDELAFTTENSHEITQRTLPTMAAVIGGGIAGA